MIVARSLVYVWYMVNGGPAGPADERKSSCEERK